MIFRVSTEVDFTINSMEVRPLKISCLGFLFILTFLSSFKFFFCSEVESTEVESDFGGFQLFK